MCEVSTSVASFSTTVQLLDGKIKYKHKDRWLNNKVAIEHNLEGRGLAVMSVITIFYHVFCHYHFLPCFLFSAFDWPQYDPVGYIS